jgi:hypothetical protein
MFVRFPLQSTAATAVLRPDVFCVIDIIISHENPWLKKNARFRRAFFSECELYRQFIFQAIFKQIIHTNKSL